VIPGSDLPAAGCLHVADVYQTGEFYVRLLKILVERYQLAKFSPIETTEVRFTSSELKRALPTISDGLLAAVPDLLDTEPPTMGGSSGVALDLRGSGKVDADRRRSSRSDDAPYGHGRDRPPGGNRWR
jgi:hypothetical protein